MTTESKYYLSRCVMRCGTYWVRSFEIIRIRISDPRLLGSPCPSCQTSDSPRKLSGQPSSLSKRKRGQRTTGSGNHHAMLHATKFALTKGCSFSAGSLKLHLAKTFGIYCLRHSLYTAETFEVYCLGHSVYHTLAAMTLYQASPSGICRWRRQEL